MYALNILQYHYSEYMRYP